MSEEIKEDVAVEATEEETTDEATKMLSAAMQKAMEAGDEVAQAKLKSAQDAVEGMLDSVAAAAKAKTVVAEVETKQAPFDVEETRTALTKLQRNVGSVSVTVKDLKDLNYLAKTTDITNDLTGEVIAPVREAGIEDIATRSPFIEQISDVVQVNSDTVKWTEVQSVHGAGPATTAELAKINEQDYKFITRSTPVEKIAVISKYSVEILKFGPELIAAVRSMIQRDVNLAVDAQLLSGNGSTPNLQGVLGVANELDAAAIGPQRIANANLFDVVRIAATKIMVAGKGKFTPNFLALNPVDSERFDLTKDAQGNYIMPPFYSPTGQTIRGARVIENTGVTPGEFLLGDFNYLHVRPNGGVEVDFSNSDDKDFQNDILAIKVRRFLAAYVKTNNNGAFVKGDISAIIALLTGAADTTPPNLSAPVGTKDGATAANGSVTTDEGNGTLYWVVATGATPSAAQMKAGQMSGGGAADGAAGSQVITAAGNIALSPAPTGLTTSTTYKIFYMHEDMADNQSTVSATTNFTTD